MPFVKGMKKHPLSGKVKGSTHSITFPKARDEILKSGKNPIAEILNLIPILEPKDQIKSWFEILSWLEAKPKEILETTDESNLEVIAQALSKEDIEWMIQVARGSKI